MAHGLRKVAVDDLVRAVGIAKGSFYSFYQNKEHLYMDILAESQKKVWLGADAFLRQHRALAPRQLTKSFFQWLLESLMQYPLLLQTDSELLGYLYRKLPAGVVETHTQDDEEMFRKLEQYGVRFARDLTIITKTAQVLAASLIQVWKMPEEETTKQAIMEMLLDGFVNQAVEE